MIKVTHSLVILSFYFLVFNKLVAQPYVDILNMRYQHFPKVKFRNKEGRVLINEYCVATTVPIVFKNKNVLILGAAYDQLDFSFTRPSDRKTLYGISMQLGYLHHWDDDKYKLLVMAIPKSASDMLLVDERTFQQAGLAMFTYKRKENLFYKLGCYYSPEFFGNFYMPLVGIEWKPTPRLNIYGYMPASFNLEYKWTDNWYLGLSYFNLTQSYRMVNAPIYVRNGDRFWGNMQFKTFVNYYFKKYYVLYAEFGYTLWRTYNTYQNYSTKEELTIFQQSQNGPLVNIGFAFRIRTDQR